MLDKIQSFDNSIIFFINEYIQNIPRVQLLFKYISMLGNSGAIWIIIAIVLMLNKKSRPFAITMVFALLFGSLLGSLLKITFARSRPFLEHSFINICINAPKGYSFPSGHTLSSFISATLLYNLNKKYGVYFVVLAVLIGISRIILMVHYPTDVFAGAILGTIIGFSFFKIYKAKFS